MDHYFKFITILFLLYVLVFGLQAICDYLKMDLYIFFFSGDILSHTWERADLGGEKEKHKQLNCFEIALLLLSELRKGQHGN